MNLEYTILVNSCDNFEDCWSPFFTLFKKNWKNCNAPILLNTEYKEYNYEGLNIKTSKVQSLKKQRLTWSECLINALEMTDTPLVLYLQEDYFIDKPVKSNEIEEFSKLMIKDKSIKHIGLTDHGAKPPFTKFKSDKRLCLIGQNSNYRISTQAGLWDRETLLSYLRAEENGWMFEIFGTKRAQKKNEIFLTVSEQFYNLKANPIISYIHTGIIKGKWHQEIPNLFKQNRISVNFNERGFYKPKPLLFRKIETARKLLKDPLKFFNGMLGK